MRASAVLDLQRHRDYPSVSILVRTTPGAALTHADRARLQARIDDVARRLRDDVGADTAIDLVERLRDLADTTARRPVRRSLALFASPGTASAHVLDVEVHERTMVDDSFATRDLLDQVRLAEAFVVVTVSEQRLRAFDCGPDGPVGVRSAHGVLLAREEDDSPRVWERQVVATIRDLDRRGKPLVLVGVERRVVAFLRAAGVRPAAMVHGSHDHTPPAALVALVRPALGAWEERRTANALRRLDAARSRHLWATGLDELWSLARESRVELLVVERSCAVPVRVVGEHLVPVGPAEVEAPDVIDDAVDDLIEAVAVRRGEVVLVPDGTLRDTGGLAAVLRY
ncbi:MAG: hypothetical protein ACOYOP_09915 [Microthrixaceae bacterium]